MPYRTRRGGGGGGGGGGASAWLHDNTLDGAGTNADPAGLAAAEVAKIDEAHDVHRVVLARWTVTAGQLGRGRRAYGYGYARIIEASADGEPTETAGSINPDPPLLSEGSAAWRLVEAQQDVASHDVQISLGAPLGPRTVHARGRVTFQAASQFAAVPTAYRIPASRDVAYEFEVPAGGGQWTRVEVTADQLRALNPAAAGQSSTPRNHSVDLGVHGGVRYRAGRTALGQILLSMDRAGAQNVGVFSNDGPPAADPPDVPTWIDWRLGSRTLRGRDARIGGADRQQPPGGSLRDEGVVTLTWRDDPTTGLRFAAGVIGDGDSVALEALGRDVSTSRLLPATPTDGQVPQYDATEEEWTAVDPSSFGGGGGQGQQGGGASLDSLIGTRTAVALTQAQARLRLNSPDGAPVSARTAAVALPAAAAAGDRLVAKWAWVARPGAARLADLTIALRDVTGGADLDALWPIWDADSGVLAWELPAGCASVLFAGRFDPAAAADLTIDMSAVEVHSGAQSIARYVEGRARRIASLAADQAREIAEAHADQGDALNALATDATVTSVVRTARWARAWIRAGGQAAALAGVAAATWTNQGAGTPPTGAHWDVGDVPAGADPLWELTSLASPTAGSNSAWTFGAWAALQITATNTQYSVDGASGWHAARAPADRWERHRQIGGSWGAAIPLYAADELVWTRLLEQTFTHQTTRWLPGFLWELPSTVFFSRLQLMRIRLLASTSVPVLEGDVVIRPDFFASETYANRSAANPDLSFVWQLRMDAAGLQLVKGAPYVGTGANGDGEDAGFSLVWHRPSGVSSAGEARYLRLIFIKTLGVSYRLTMEAI